MLINNLKTTSKIQVIYTRLYYTILTFLLVFFIVLSENVILLV